MFQVFSFIFHHFGIRKTAWCKIFTFTSGSWGPGVLGPGVLGSSEWNMPIWKQVANKLLFLMISMVRFDHVMKYYTPNESVNKEL